MNLSNKFYESASGMQFSKLKALQNHESLIRQQRKILSRNFLTIGDCKGDLADKSIKISKKLNQSSLNTKKNPDDIEDGKKTKNKKDGVD